MDFRHDFRELPDVLGCWTTTERAIPGSCAPTLQVIPLCGDWLAGVPLGEWLGSLAAPTAHALDHAERQADGLGNALLGPLDSSSAENALMVGKRFGTR
jgi:hypothetical protein